MELNTQPIERVNYTDDDTLDVVQVWKWVRCHHGRYQVSNTDIPSILHRIKSGERQNQIAREYGVSPCTINDIWKGRRPCN